MSRFQITYAPQASPGQCRICGGAKLPLIDMQYSEDSYGAVYYCKDCIVEIANLLDYISPKQHQTLVEHCVDLTASLYSANATLVLYNHLENGLKDAGFIRMVHGSTSAGDVSDSSISDSNVIETSPVFSESVNVSAERLAESTDGEIVGSTNATQHGGKVKARI